MKRFLTILLTTLALTAALCVNASAANFDSLAEELAAIGMFKGTADGFALFHMVIAVSDAKQLQQIIRKLHNISSVMKVNRPAG